MSEPVFQSNLGDRANNRNESQRTWNQGFLALGRILKIHHKSNTADVKLYGTGDSITSMETKEGVHACRIGVNVAGTDSYYHLPYGEIRPLEEGMTVLVGFLRNNKKQPVIINAFHDISENVGETNTGNILPTVYPLESERDIYRYLKITRLQDVFTMDGEGNIEASVHGKSFLTLTSASINTDTFGYEDLSTKNKTTGNTVGLPENASPEQKLLGVIQDYAEKTQSRIMIRPGRSSVHVLADGVNVASIYVDKSGEVRISAKHADIVAPTKITGNLTVDGDVGVSGQITAVGDVIGGTVSLIHHTHPGRHGDTGEPYPGSGGGNWDGGDNYDDDGIGDNDDGDSVGGDSGGGSGSGGTGGSGNTTPTPMVCNPDPRKINPLIQSFITDSLPDILTEILPSLINQNLPESQPEKIQDTLYNTGGLAADIVVNSLSTSQEIKKYLAQDTTDNNYIHVERETISFCAGLSPTGVKHVTNPLGEPLYWERDPSGSGVTLGANGFPYYNGERVKITTTQTQYPVQAYNYTLQEKFKIAYEQESTDGNGNPIYTPTITLGAGNAQNKNQAIIRKGVNGLEVKYTPNSGDVTGITCDTSGNMQVHGFVKFLNSANDLPQGHENMDTIFVIPA